MRGITHICALIVLFIAGCQPTEPELTCGLGECHDANGNPAQPKELGLTERDALVWACELTEIPQIASVQVDVFFLRLNEEDPRGEHPYCFGRGSSDGLQCFSRSIDEGVERFDAVEFSDGQPSDALLIQADGTASYEQVSLNWDTGATTTRTYTGNCVKGGAY